METVTKEKAEARKKKLFNLRDDVGGALTSLEKARYAAETIGYYFASTIETEEDKQIALYCFDTHRTVSDILSDYLFELQEAMQSVHSLVNDLFRSEVKDNE